MLIAWSMCVIYLSHITRTQQHTHIHTRTCKRCLCCELYVRLIYAYGIISWNPSKQSCITKPLFHYWTWIRMCSAGSSMMKVHTLSSNKIWQFIFPFLYSHSVHSKSYCMFSYTSYNVICEENSIQFRFLLSNRSYGFPFRHKQITTLQHIEHAFNTTEVSFCFQQRILIFVNWIVESILYSISIGRRESIPS